ncbi:MAG: hypothetical protein ACE5JU_00145 [Candidatus Binatia bacterium]
MTRSGNPVFQEGVQVYLTDGQGLMVYFFYLIIFALLQFLALILPTGEPQFWMGPAYLFKFSSVAALLLMVYFGLRLANQEFVSWRFEALKRWVHQQGIKVSGIALGQISLLALHAMIFILLSFPLLAWAGAVARTPVGSILSTLLLLLFYSITYSVWGLVALALWEHRVDSRRVFIRWLFVCLVLLSGLLYLPLNPVAFLLYHLGGLELGAPLELWGWRWEGPEVHFVFHFVLLASSLLLYGWALKRLKRGFA